MERRETEGEKIEWEAAAAPAGGGGGGGGGEGGWGVRAVPLE